MPTYRLTDKQVAGAKAEAGARVELWDALTPGLALRVSDRGRKTWIVRYRTLDGRQPRFTLGTYPAMDLKEAREQARDATKSARGGDDPSTKRRRESAAAKAEPMKSLDDLATIYFAACEIGEWMPRDRKKRESTLAEERSLYRRHLKTQLGDLRVEDVTPDATRQRLREIVAKGNDTTSNRVRALLRQMLNFAIHEERISINPVNKVRSLGSETARERVLSDAELKTVWAAIKDPTGLRKAAAGDEKGDAVYIGPAVSIALRLLLLTMARRSEVAGMRIEELDLAQASWIIPGVRTKNGKPLLVPLSAECVSLIRSAIDLARTAPGANETPSPFVFPSPRNRLKPITSASLSHAVRDLRLALGLPRFTPHDLRRTASTIMASERLGITMFLIGRIINHITETGGAAPVTAKHYALHQYAVEKRSALQAWEDLLLEIVGERERPTNVRQMSEARR